MNLHHIAFVSSDIEKSVEWYKEKWDANLIYKDKTWALIEMAGTRIAFVKDHHPPHVGFEVDRSFIDEHAQDFDFKFHRDGSKYSYIKDPDGNVIEILSWDHNG